MHAVLLELEQALDQLESQLNEKEIAGFVDLELRGMIAGMKRAISISKKYL